jgi:NUDIX domain
VDKDETPADACRRELLEETGFPAKKVHELGCYAPCTARMSNRVHSFFIETGPRVDPPTTEAGIELKLVTPRELAVLILAGEFVLQLHIGPAARRHARPPRPRGAPLGETRTFWIGSPKNCLGGPGWPICGCGHQKIRRSEIVKGEEIEPLGAYSSTRAGPQTLFMRLDLSNEKWALLEPLPRTEA